MGPKPGRPLTDSPKDFLLQVRLDEKTKNDLDYCAKRTDSNRSIVVRKGIELVKENLDEGREMALREPDRKGNEKTFNKKYDVKQKEGGSVRHQGKQKRGLTPKSEFVGFRIAPDAIRKLDELAEAKETSRSEIVREGIEKVYKETKNNA